MKLIPVQYRLDSGQISSKEEPGCSPQFCQLAPVATDPSGATALFPVSVGRNTHARGGTHSEQNTQAARDVKRQREACERRGPGPSVSITPLHKHTHVRLQARLRSSSTSVFLTSQTCTFIFWSAFPDGASIPLSAGAEMWDPLPPPPAGLQLQAEAIRSRTLR